MHFERVTEQKSRAESRLVAYANGPGSRKMALAATGCGSAGRSLISCTLNFECLLLPCQNAGAGLPAGEEILKSNCRVEQGGFLSKLLDAFCFP